MKLEWEIIKRFSINDTPCITTDDVKREFPDVSSSYLNNVLTGMVKSNMLIRLIRGLYYIVPLGQNNPKYIPDWHLVAKYLMRNKNYYVGYYSALQIHKLITQPSMTEIIVTDNQVIPRKIEIQDVRFQFVYHKQERFFGAKNTWIDNYNKVQCSDIEKTLVDSFINPKYSNGIVEIAKAVYETKDKISTDKIIDYFTRAGSKVAARRYAYICNILDIDLSYHDDLLRNNLSGSYLLLDPSAPDEGRINRKFELKINRDEDTIRNAMYT